MLSQFRAVSLSHSNTPLQVRETFALNQEQLNSFSLKLREIFSISDLLILSTCNRTEIYYSSEIDLSQNIIKSLSAEKGLIDHTLYLPFFQIHETKEAVLRLFEVSAGLHSKVVGDLQIPNQIKQAYQNSADLDLAGPFLHRLMHTIFFTNKRIAQETSFRDGAASVNYVAVSLIEELVQPINDPKILVLGLGEIGSDVCKNLADKEFANVTVINRTLARAKTVAARHNFKVANMADLELEIAKADIVISSVRAENPIVTKLILSNNPPLTFKYLIDLSIPRSIENEAESVPGILVYNIDTLQAKASEALAKRMEAIPQVKEIISEAVESFEDWSKEVIVSPTINKLKNALELIRKEEMARYLKGITPDQTDVIDKITTGIVQKILKMPVLQLKAACKRGNPENMIDLINELFDLENQKEKI